MRKCTACHRQIKSHVLVHDNRDFCGKVCVCSALHKSKEQKSCFQCTPTFGGKQKKADAVTTVITKKKRRGRAIAFV